jgi:recombination protein RecA
MAMAKNKNKESAGKVSIGQLRDLLNKKSGREVAYDLQDENPTEVTDWIPTGSRWLDSIICRGKLAGIPVGKISELAGLEGSGKSYMAAQIAANAQKMGIDVIYFDSESAIDPEFMKKAGCDMSRILYVQAENVEYVLESIEDLLKNNQNRMLFIWDSMALTPSKTDLEGDFDPQSSMAVKPRILAKGLSKLIQPIANSQSTLLVLNQLKTNLQVQNIKYATDSERYTTPGGKALSYAYSLRVWLTGRKAKDSYVLDERGYKVGSEVKARLEKSRFGTAGRECLFKIMWGGAIGVLDNESIFEAIKPFIKQTGAWYETEVNGQPKKFQQSAWEDLMKEESFKAAVLEIMDREVIVKFDTREGDAKNFYNIEGEENVDPTTGEVLN